ncbi:MAG: hypothetical protein ACYC5Y_06035 [Symbiobacteriia bacterium]
MKFQSALQWFNFGGVVLLGLDKLLDLRNRKLKGDAEAFELREKRKAASAADTDKIKAFVQARHELVSALVQTAAQFEEAAKGSGVPAANFMSGPPKHQNWGSAWFRFKSLYSYMLTSSQVASWDTLKQAIRTGNGIDVDGCAIIAKSLRKWAATMEEIKFRDRP